MVYSSRSGNATTISLRNSGIIRPITAFALGNQGMIFLNVKIWLITIHNSGFCTDLENGITTTGSKVQVQTWTCSDDNWTNSFTRPLFR